MTTLETVLVIGYGYLMYHIGLHYGKKNAKEELLGLSKQ